MIHIKQSILQVEIPWTMLQIFLGVMLAFHAAHLRHDIKVRIFLLACCPSIKDAEVNHKSVDSIFYFHFVKSVVNALIIFIELDVFSRLEDYHLRICFYKLLIDV